MTQNAPGKHYRKGLSLVALTNLFPDDATAERWFVKSRWPAGIACSKCNSRNVQERPTRKPQPFRCRDCRNDFSTKTGTLMQGSPLGFRVWAIALYLLSTGLKGTSSMKLYRDLDVTQKTAWYLAHRIREAWSDKNAPFAGPVEVDETFVGGKAKNMHAHKRKQVIKGRGAVGKTAVVGAKDRATNRVSAAVVKERRPAYTPGLRSRERRAWNEGVYRRPRRLRGAAEPRDGPPLSEGVRQRASPHERHRVILGNAQAWLRRHVPPDEPEASAPLRGRIRRTPQRQNGRYHRPNASAGTGHGRQEAEV